MNIDLTGSSRHLIVVPPSTQLLSEALIASPILAGDRSASIPEQLLPGGAEVSGGGANTTNNFEFGVDPNLDPELALVRTFTPFILFFVFNFSKFFFLFSRLTTWQALRISMQEAQAWEAAAAAAAAAAGGSSTNSAQTQVSSSTPSAPVSHTVASAVAPQSTTIPAGQTEDDEDRQLQQALAMSTQEDEDVDMEDQDDAQGEDDDEDEDEAIQKAIAMSMQIENMEKGKDENRKK